MKLIPPSPDVLRHLATVDVDHPFKELDYETVGYFLSCHLMIDYYISEYLKRLYPELNWQGTRLDFSAKISLISKSFKLRTDIETKKFFDALKHLNALRNKLAHNLDFRLTLDEMKPLVSLSGVFTSKKIWKEKPSSVLHVFTFHTVLLLDTFGKTAQ